MEAAAAAVQGEGGREGLGRLCRGVLVAAGNAERGWKTGWC